MAEKASGFGKPKLKRTEPREIGPSAAAPEPLTGVREQVREDDSATESCRQCGGTGRHRVKPWRTRNKCGASNKRGPRRMLTDRQWKRVRRFLFGEPGKDGRNALDNRGKLEGMLWVFRTGSPWRDVPPEFGNWQNVYQTFRRWAKRGVFLQMFLALVRGRDLKVVMVDGTFIKVHKHGAGAPRGTLTPEESQVAQAIGKSRGGLTTKLMALVDRRGRLVALSLVPGNADEGRQLAGLLDGVDVTSIEELLADKAFDRDSIRDMLAGIRVKDTIPWKSNRKNPRPYDKRKYKGRHLVENLFVDVKEFRGLATRYCKYAHTFCAGLHLATWHLETRGRELRLSPYV